VLGGPPGQGISWHPPANSRKKTSADIGDECFPLEISIVHPNNLGHALRRKHLIFLVIFVRLRERGIPSKIFPDGQDGSLRIGASEPLGTTFGMDGGSADGISVMWKVEQVISAGFASEETNVLESSPIPGISSTWSANNSAFIDFRRTDLPGSTSGWTDGLDGGV